MKVAPPGHRHIRRPKTRAEVREDLHRLVRRRGLAWDDLWKLKQEGIRNGEPYGLYDEDLEKIDRQMDEVLALQKDFCNTRLVDFRMPPPSPPCELLHLLTLDSFPNLTALSGFSCDHKPPRAAGGSPSH